MLSTVVIARKDTLINICFEEKRRGGNVLAELLFNRYLYIDMIFGYDTFTVNVALQSIHQVK